MQYLAGDPSAESPSCPGRVAHRPCRPWVPRSCSRGTAVPGNCSQHGCGARPALPQIRHPGQTFWVLARGGGALLQVAWRRRISQRHMRALARCVALAACCAALSATAGGAELDEDAARLEEQMVERAARRGQAIRDLQAHAKQGYKPGADVMEGARDGGALGLSEYLQALLGWEDDTWATVKRVGTYGCVRACVFRLRCVRSWTDHCVVWSLRKYACYTLLVLLTLGVFKCARFSSTSVLRLFTVDRACCLLCVLAGCGMR